jgi:hypothetical protein
VANIEENDFKDVHLMFFGEGVEYKFEAEYDNGNVEVEIKRKERGAELVESNTAKTQVSDLADRGFRSPVFRLMLLSKALWLDDRFS